MLLNLAENICFQWNGLRALVERCCVLSMKEEQAATKSSTVAFGNGIPTDTAVFRPTHASTCPAEVVGSSLLRRTPSFLYGPERSFTERS
jgi:hypothetical protein